MASTRQIHQEKLRATAEWLVRWGICDAASLIFVSGAQLEDWPLRCVKAGIAKRVRCPAATGFTQRYLYVPTSIAREIAASRGFQLPIMSAVEYNRSARHRIITQRIIVKLARDLKQQGWTYQPDRTVTEREMRRLAAHEQTLRQPDAFVSFVKSEQCWRIAIETETEPKSMARRAAMAAGIAEILQGNNKDAFGARNVVIALPTDGAIERYRKVMCEGAEYENHKQLNGAIVPCGGKGLMPNGVIFWRIDDIGEVHSTRKKNNLNIELCCWQRIL
jgi:hypothetical protein